MPTDIGAHFGRFARTYDAGRRTLIPPYEAFFGTAVDVVLHHRPAAPVARVLDLGAGTGLLAALVAAALPDTHVTLLDASGEMLALAPERLGPDWARCDAIVGEFPRDLPGGPFDAVVSALAIHHLPHTDKRALFAAVHERLVPGGVFALWSDDPPDDDVITMLESVFIDVEAQSVWFDNPLTRGRSAATIYLATRR